MELDTTLGIDIGTTTVKSTFVNTNYGILSSYSLDSKSEVPIIGHNDYHEQSVQKIIRAFVDSIEELYSLSEDCFKTCSAIMLCGQMHGILFWNSSIKTYISNLKEMKEFSYDSDYNSNLITWQDGRSSEESLKNIRKRSYGQCVGVHSGFGCATIHWMSLYGTDILEKYDLAGTIMDFIAWLLTNNDVVYMGPSLAASWGLFDLESLQWDYSTFDMMPNFPMKFLPKVTHEVFLPQSLRIDLFSLKAGCKVGVPLGDLQCSYLACIFQNEDVNLVLNIGTSAQLMIKLNSLKKLELPSSVAFVPFFGEYIAVAASLNGGNVIQWFVDTVINWTKEVPVFDKETKKCESGKLWSYLTEHKPDEHRNYLDVKPFLFRERHHEENQRFSIFINNSIMLNISLRDMFYSLCRGLVENIKSMLSIESFGVSESFNLVCCGNAVLKNRVLQSEIEKAFSSYKLGSDVLFLDNLDASYGACIAGIRK